MKNSNFITHPASLRDTAWNPPVLCQNSTYLIDRNPFLVSRNETLLRNPGDRVTFTV